MLGSARIGNAGARAEWGEPGCLRRALETADQCVDDNSRPLRRVLLRAPAVMADPSFADEFFHVLCFVHSPTPKGVGCFSVVTHPHRRKVDRRDRSSTGVANEEQNQEARRVCEQVLGAAAALGLGAPDAAWLAAVAASNTKDLEAAVRYARRALEADPTSPSYRRSFDVIKNNVRQALLDDKLAPDDATIPALHGLAVDAEAVD